MPESDEELLKEVFKITTNHPCYAPPARSPQVKQRSYKSKTFTMAFDVDIQSRVPSNADRLNYLDQHLIRELKDLVSCCLYIQPDKDYAEARKLLKKENGEPYKVSNTFM